MKLAAKTREPTAHGARKKKFLRRDFGDLEVQMGVRDATSPIAVLGTTDLGNNWGRGPGTAPVGREALVPASKSAFSPPGRPACPGTHWKLKVVLLEREEARDQTFHRDSGRR